MSEQDIKQLKNNAVRELEKFLEDLECSGKTDQKRCKLISYWVKDYIKFLRKEQTFESHKALAYNRGDIIKVHFGFRIGHEFGGLHYAIVVSKVNPKHSGTLTVVPLKSQKDSGKLRRTEVDLGDEFFRAMVSKKDIVYNRIKQETDRIKEELKNHNDRSKENRVILEEDIKKLQLQLEPFNRIHHEILRMKKGSIADVGQICTISKIRILDPTHSAQPLAGIRLSPTTLSAIDKKVKELLMY